MKTFIYGTYSYTFASDLSSVTITIPHNMGHKGAVWLSVGYVGVNYMDVFQTYYDDGAGNAAYVKWTVKSNANNIQIIYSEDLVEGSGVNNTGFFYDFKFYVFVESIA